MTKNVTSRLGEAQRDSHAMTEFSNVIAAFSEEQVERLTGLTAHRLRYWDRTNLFKPSLADENRRAAYSRVYSFKDLASLRVMAALCSQFSVSTRELRKAAKRLAEMNIDGWNKTKLYVLKKRVVFVDPETETPREIVSGQFVVPVVLQEVLVETKAEVAKLHERPFYHRGKIDQNRLVAHNLPVIAGTRIPVRAIKNFSDAGYTPEQIIQEYPDLTLEDIQAALSHSEKTKAA